MKKENNGKLPETYIEEFSTVCHAEDEFDLYYGYAMLHLQQTCGSKRQRKLTLQNHFGELYTPENEILLTKLFAARKFSTYDEFKEYKYVLDFFIVYNEDINSLIALIFCDLLDLCFYFLIRLIFL